MYFIAAQHFINLLCIISFYILFEKKIEVYWSNSKFIDSETTYLFFFFYIFLCIYILFILLSFFLITNKSNILHLLFLFISFLNIAFIFIVFFLCGFFLISQNNLFVMSDLKIRRILSYREFNAIIDFRINYYLLHSPIAFDLGLSKNDFSFNSETLRNIAEESEDITGNTIRSKLIESIDKHIEARAELIRIEKNAWFTYETEKEKLIYLFIFFLTNLIV